MKTAIHLGLVLMAVGIVCVQRSNDRPAEPVRMAPWSSRVTERLKEAPGVVQPRVVEAASPIPQARGVEAPAAAKSVAVPGWRRMLATAELKLSLTATQRMAMQEILEDREKEIKSWHDSMRKAGILDLRHYEWQIGLMRESWYRRVDALLDGYQHGEFLGLVGQGFMNEGLAFTVETGMTVLD